MRKSFFLLLFYMCFIPSISWGVSIGLPFQERNLPSEVIPVVEALQKEDYYKAAVLAEDLLKKDPKNKFALAYLAAAYAGVGLDHKISTLLKQYQELAPQDTNIYLQVATTYLIKNRPQKAIQILEEAQKVNPNSASVLFLLAKLYDKNGQYLKAISLLERGLQQESKNSEAKILLVKILIKVDQYEKAHDFLRKFLKLDPQNIDLKILEARVLAFEGRLKEAQKIIISLHGTNKKSFWETKALVANLSGNLEEAFNAYQEILKIDPNDLPTIINLALIYKRKGEWEKAAELFEEALKKNANIRPIYPQLIIIYTDYIPQPERAQKLIKLALQKFGNISDPQLFDAIGWYYYQNGKYDKACYFFSKAADIQKNALVLYHQGLCLEKLGQKEKARKKFKEALNHSSSKGPLTQKIHQHLSKRQE